jgi:hypothetical protein
MGWWEPPAGGVACEGCRGGQRYLATEGQQTRWPFYCPPDPQCRIVKLAASIPDRHRQASSVRLYLRRQRSGFTAFDPPGRPSKASASRTSSSLAPRREALPYTLVTTPLPNATLSNRRRSRAPASVRFENRIGVSPSSIRKQSSGWTSNTSERRDRSDWSASSHSLIFGRMPHACAPKPRPSILRCNSEAS